MTTIAYDSRQTRGDRIVSDSAPKCQVVDGVSFFLSAPYATRRP